MPTYRVEGKYDDKPFVEYSSEHAELAFAKTEFAKQLAKNDYKHLTLVEVKVICEYHSHEE